VNQRTVRMLETPILQRSPRTILSTYPLSGGLAPKLGWPGHDLAGMDSCPSNERYIYLGFRLRGSARVSLKAPGNLKDP